MLAEVDAFPWKESDGISFEHLKSFPYTRAVIDEAMRCCLLQMFQIIQCVPDLKGPAFWMCSRVHTLARLPGLWIVRAIGSCALWLLCKIRIGQHALACFFLLPVCMSTLLAISHSGRGRRGRQWCGCSPGRPLLVLSLPDRTLHSTSTFVPQTRWLLPPAGRGR